jgi:hypothetical protein
MDGQNEDELLLSLLRELRRRNEREDVLREIITKATDTMAVVNQTCVRIHEAIERVEARLSLFTGAAE